MADNGLSDEEARGFHRYFVLGFVSFTGVAIVAHFLAWQWRPWLPGAAGYTSSIVEDARQMAAFIPYAFLA